MRLRNLTLLVLLLLPASLLAQGAFSVIGHADLLKRLQGRDIVLLDVRTPAEFAAGHIPGAVNIPHDELANKAGELLRDRNAEIAVYCRSGRRSLQALTWLKAQGFRRLLHVEGDFLGWQAAGLAIEGTASAR